MGSSSAPSSSPSPSCMRNLRKRGKRKRASSEASEAVPQQGEENNRRSGGGGVGIRLSSEMTTYEGESR